MSSICLSKFNRMHVWTIQTDRIFSRVREFEARSDMSKGFARADGHSVRTLVTNFIKMTHPLNTNLTHLLVTEL